MTSLNREERHLIAIQGLYFFAGGLASIFVTIFLFAHSDLRTTIFFQFWTFSSTLFFFELSGWSLRKFSSGAHMKLSVATSALFYLLLFILQDRTIRYLIPLALLNGFGIGIYWAAYNLNQYIFSNEAKREQYFGYSSALVNMLSAVAPFLGGVIIFIGSSLWYGASAGYAILFFLVFLLRAFMIFFIGKLPSHEMPLFSYRHMFTKHRSRRWTLVLWQHILFGMYDIALGTVTGVLFYLILKEEVWVGAVQTVGYILGTVGGVTCAKLLEKQHRYFWVGAIGLSAALVVFALFQNPVGLWIFVIISGFTGPFLNTWISSLWFQTMDTIADHFRNKYHLLLERDMALGLSRIVSLAFLYIYLSYGDQVALAKEWLYFLPILPLGIGILLHMSGSPEKKHLSKGM
ncbi:MAG: hypothetical protein AAB508_00535 [Patescibacteria group bacterium]